MEHDTVRIPSPKEMEAFIKDQDILEAHVKELTDEEKDKVFDMGYHNDTVKGYTALIMKAAGFTDEDVKKALSKADKVLKENSAFEARSAYEKCQN